jgi:hypothetical protein
MRAFDGSAIENSLDRSPDKMRRHAWIWLGLGTAGLAAAYFAHVRAALYVLVFCSLLYGVFLLTASRLRSENAFTTTRRTRFDVGVHAPARARAVLLLVHAVHDLYLHNARRRQAALRIQ